MRFSCPSVSLLYGKHLSLAVGVELSSIVIIPEKIGPVIHILHTVTCKVAFLSWEYFKILSSAPKPN